jgi:hypothetical protein
METAPNHTPDCPVCLMQLDVAGSEQHPYFVCSLCDLAFLGTADDRQEARKHAPSWPQWGLAVQM